MALLQQHVCALIRNNVRAFSQQGAVKKTVLISQSKDIYTNLALEDWLYKNNNFANSQVLLLWQNDPCVVIGRHQNPWLESNVHELGNITENGVKLARRNSGGGTVYHDNGNLNMTFFTAREHYNRRYNLEVITRALFREYALKLDISSREDLTFRNCKVSGTAAKLGRPSAYHHCTLLVNVNKKDLQEALHKQDLGIETNATKSIPSKVMNLCEENPKVTVDTLITAVGYEYLRTTPFKVQDGGMELANQQNGFQMVNPTNEWFPGIGALRTDLSDWNWCYGKSPRFTITRSFSVAADNQLHNTLHDVKVTLTIEHGQIGDVTLFVPATLMPNGFEGAFNVVTHLKGSKFDRNVLNHLESMMADILQDKEKNLSDSVQRAMTSV